MSNISPQICKVTNIFRNTNVRIAFRCRNTIAKLIKPPKDHDILPHNKWGIYQLTCNTCSQSYVGQTSRSLNIHFQEHIRYIKKNIPQSTNAQYILQNQHKIQPDEKYNDRAKTSKEPKHAHPLQTILHPNPLPRRQTHSGAKHRRNKATISNGH